MPDKNTSFVPYPDDELIPLSSLQNLIFCERQFALINLEQVWEDNRLTAEGTVLHESVDQARSESRTDVRQTTAVRISSRRLGLIGVMDMLEFHRVATSNDTDHSLTAINLPRSRDLWIPFPVEYKRGKPKAHRADEVQLCAQAICLEEMLHVEIKQGALFYGEPRRRTEVVFDAVLRKITEDAATKAHKIIDAGLTPPAKFAPHCKSCSLVEMCQPKTVSQKSAKLWFEKRIGELLS